MLEHNEAKTVWVESRRHLDVPKPPLGFSELQWARMLFEIECQVGMHHELPFHDVRFLITLSWCGTSSVQDVDWQIRKRICGSCKLVQ